jgi:hypothetical protein
MGSTISYYLYGPEIVVTENSPLTTVNDGVITHNNSSQRNIVSGTSDTS